MADDDLDLESCWRDLRPHAFVEKEPTSKFKESLKDAYERSNERLVEELKGHQGQTVTVELLAKIVSKGVSLFMQEWQEGLRRQNLAGLIEIILEGQDLTASEMHEFVRALPYSLLERICKSAVGSATGIHGLMAIEYAHRNRSIRHYGVVQDGARTYVAFTNLEGVPVTFYLDEKFELFDDGT